VNSRFDYTILQAIENAVRTVKAAPLILGATASGFGGPIGGFVGYLPQTRVSYDPIEDATLFTPVSGMSLLDNLNHIRYRISQVEASGVGAITFLELTDTPDTYVGEAGKSVVVNPTEDGLIFSTISGGSGSIAVLSSGVEIVNPTTELDFYNASVVQVGSRAEITILFPTVDAGRVLFSDGLGNVTTDSILQFVQSERQMWIGGDPLAGFTSGRGYNIVTEGGTGLTPRFRAIHFGDSLSFGPGMSMWRGGGTRAAPTAVLSGMQMGQYAFGGYFDSSGTPTGTRGAIYIIANEDWSSTSQPVRIEFWVCPSGSTTLALASTINSDGSLSLNNHNLKDVIIQCSLT